MFFMFLFCSAFSRTISLKDSGALNVGYMNIRQQRNLLVLLVYLFHSRWTKGKNARCCLFPQRRILGQLVPPERRVRNPEVGEGEDWGSESRFSWERERRKGRGE